MTFYSWKPIVIRFKKITAVILFAVLLSFSLFNLLILYNVSVVESFLWLVIFAIVVGLIALYMMWPRFDLSPDITLKLPKKYVALSFDDGPTEGFTEEILTILKDHSVCATFFVLGQKAKKYSSVVKMAIRQGHEIGVHSYNHKKLHLAGLKEIDRQIQKTGDVIDQLYKELKNQNKRIKIFRPPNGRKNILLKYYLKKNEYSLIPWTREVWDYLAPDASWIIRKATKRPSKNEIVLLHDGLGNDENVIERQKQGLLKALPEIIKYYKKNGYTFVKASAFIKDKN